VNEALIKWFVNREAVVQFSPELPRRAATLGSVIEVPQP
jgi:hypothetical protein